jgi:hypothetical protein
MVGVRLRLTALALFAVAVISTSCGSGSSATLDEYFPRVAALTADLDAAHITPSAGGSTVSEASLRTFASALDRLDAPSAAKQAHHDLTVASKNLADATNRASAETSASSRADSAIFVRDWQAACHRLQDVALARKMEVDLRCATALHAIDNGG